MWKAIFLLSASSLIARDRIAAIDFYGSKGMDTEAVRRTLPFREGDPKTEQTTRMARETVKRVTGRDATEVAWVCCDPNGDTYIFIGLPGASSKTFATNPPPKGAVRASDELIALQKRIEVAEDTASKKGGDATMEDESTGYALGHDPTLRAAQLELRSYALKHEAELLHVVAGAADPLHRQYAASALGYARQSPRQVAALVKASRDASDAVRNDAIRALGVLLESKPAIAAEIPAGQYIEMMSSGVWVDRNKSCFVLDHLSRSRDPKLMIRLREEAFDPLVEMASWQSPGHAFCGKSVLARIAGVKEEEVARVAFGPVQALLDLLKIAH